MFNKNLGSNQQSASRQSAIKGTPMTRKYTNISIRMDTELKEQAEELFGELGMNISTAFNIFVRQSLRENAIPFQIYAVRSDRRRRSNSRAPEGTVYGDDTAEIFPLADYPPNKQSDDPLNDQFDDQFDDQADYQADDYD